MGIFEFIKGRIGVKYVIGVYWVGYMDGEWRFGVDVGDNVWNIVVDGVIGGREYLDICYVLYWCFYLYFV